MTENNTKETAQILDKSKKNKQFKPHHLRMSRQELEAMTTTHTLADNELQDNRDIEQQQKEQQKEQQKTQEDANACMIILEQIMSNGAKEFKEKNGREMTYSEMREMYG